MAWFDVDSLRQKDFYQGIDEFQIMKSKSRRNLFCGFFSFKGL